MGVLKKLRVRGVKEIEVDFITTTHQRFLNVSGLKVCLLPSRGASLFRFSKILNLPVQKGLSLEAPLHLLSIREEGDAGSREIIKSQQTCDLQFSQISSCI